MGTVLITGGTGFIGSTLAARLVRRGERVVLLDAHLADWRVASLPRESVRLVEGDLGDPAVPRTVLAAERPQIVVHLASVLGYRCNSDPVLATKVNCLGTAQVLEACCEVGVRRVVLASSAAIYGPDDLHGADTLPLTERAPAFLSPNQLIYSAGKVYSEALAQVYAETRGLSTCGLRPSFVFGPGRGQGGNSIVGEIVDGPAVGRTVRLGYIYVEDVAAQFELLCFVDEARLKRQRFFNTGGETVTLGQVADVVHRFIPSARLEFAEGPAVDLGGVPASVSGEAFRELFGYERAYSLEQGIEAQIRGTRAAANG